MSSVSIVQMLSNRQFALEIGRKNIQLQNGRLHLDRRLSAKSQHIATLVFLTLFCFIWSKISFKLLFKKNNLIFDFFKFLNISFAVIKLDDNFFKLILLIKFKLPNRTL